jgi:hypothetical protein
VAGIYNNATRPREIVGIFFNSTSSRLKKQRLSIEITGFREDGVKFASVVL